jgi:hypothetical protein
MKRTFLLAALLFCCSVAIFAGNGGESKKLSYISIGTGYSQFNMIDRKVSPLVYRSEQSPNCLSFYQQSERSIFRADVDFIYSYVSPKDFSERSFINIFPNHNGTLREQAVSFTKSSLIQDEISIEYLRLLKKNENGKMNLFFGGRFNQYFSYASTEAPVFVFSELSLNPSLLLRYRFSETFESQSGLSVPLLSLITQMPYSNDPTDGEHNYFVSSFLMGSHLASLNRFQRVNFQQSLIKRFNHRWAVALDYNFYWFHYRNESDINAYNNSITAKVVISLNSKK